MHDDQQFAPWGLVTPSFWDNAATPEPAGSPLPQPPAAPRTVRAQTRPEAPLPPPIPESRIVLKPVAGAAAPLIRAEEVPTQHHASLAAWRHQAVASAGHFHHHARAAGDQPEAARWARVLHELQSMDAPWGAAAELWLALASSLVMAGRTDEAAVVLPDAYQYWTQSGDRADSLAPWLHDLLVRAEGLKELADVTGQWIAARKKEG